MKNNWFRLGILIAISILVIGVIMYLIEKNNLEHREREQRLYNQELARQKDIQLKIEKENNQNMCIANVKGYFLTSFSAICESKKQKNCDATDIEIAVAYGKYIATLQPEDPFARLVTRYEKDIEACTTDHSN